MPTAIFNTDYKKAVTIMDGVGQQLHNAIAMAVAEERERCAKIAECLNGFGSARNAKSRANEVAVHIAKMIRSGA